MPRPGLVVATALVGFLVGLAGGLIGLGGAELRLPFLVGVLSLAPRQAVPVNLAVSLITVVASLATRLAGMDPALLAPWLPVTAALTAGAMFAAYVATGWLSRIDDDLLARAIGALLAVLGAVLLLEAALPLVPAGLLPFSPPLRLLAGGAAGVVIGSVSSLLGVAGGEIIIPTLVLGYGVPIATAGTLSLLVSLPTVIVGIARYSHASAFRDRTITKMVILPLAVGAVFGAPLGAWLAGAVSPALIKTLLGGLLIWSAWAVFGKAQR